ncbi:hypothetical protein AAKU67_004255 [Oxalobacteraceae bacterium GrIS 2.11]
MQISQMVVCNFKAERLNKFVKILLDQIPENTYRLSINGKQLKYDPVIQM